MTLLTALVGACAQPSATTSTLKVYVTDAPPSDEVTGIMVTIAEVQVHKAVAEQEQVGSDNQTQQDEGEWITIDISDNATTFDLLQIKGIEQFLGASEVAVGKYTQVRLVVDTIQVSLGDGELQDATVPSNELKIVRPFDVVAGEATVLTLDFEADKMVTVTGPGKIIVKPVIKLTVRQEKPTGQKDEPKQEVSLEDTEWILQSYGESGNPKDIITDTEITTEFVSSEGTVKGSAGCNSYFGGYELEGSQLSIPGPIGATEMYCAEPDGVMDQEQEYLATLQLAESYEINSDELRVNCGNQVLVFQRD
jgi:heat shock protein HslJ